MVDLSGIPPDERRYWRERNTLPKKRNKTIVYAEISEQPSRLNRAPPTIEPQRRRSIWRVIWPANQSLLASIGRIYAYIFLVIIFWIGACITL